MAQSSGDDHVVLYPACLDDEGARELVSKLYGWSVDQIKQLPGYDDLNFFIKIKSSSSAECSEFVLKVINSRESGNPDWIQAETDVLLHLTESGIPCPTPVKNLSGDYLSLEEIVDKSGKQPTGLKFIVRMLVFLPGTIVRELYQPGTTVPDKCFYTMGQFLATIDKALLDFQGPSIAPLEKKAREFRWSPNCIPLVRDILWAVTDVEKRKLAEEVLEELETQVAPKMADLRRCVLHTDFNDMNIVRQQDGPAPSETQWHTAGGLDIPANQDSWLGDLGVIDFSDIVYSNLLFDAGNSLAYMMMSQPHGDPLVSGAHFLAGYNSVLPLTSTEMSLLRCCSAARLVQSLVNGLHAYSQHPDNGYVLDTQRTGWNVLERLWSKPNQELLSMWESIAELYRPSMENPPSSSHSKEDTDSSSNSCSIAKITPTLSSKDVKRLLQKLYSVQTQDVRNIREFIAYDDQNFYVLLGGGDSATRVGGQEFVLKVINSEDSADRVAFDMQVAVLRFLTDKGFCCATPVANVQGGFLSLEKMYMNSRGGDCDDQKRCGYFLVFLLTFISGQTISKVSPVPEQLCYDVGVKMAQMDRLLWDFQDIPDSFKDRASSFIWAMESLPRVRNHLDEVKDARRRELAESVFKTFEEEVSPEISTLRKCIIHSDYNDDNILVTKTSSDLRSPESKTNNGDPSPPTKRTKSEPMYGITGVIDFSDIVYSCLVFEIAQAMGLMLYWKASDPTAATAQLLAGFQSVIPLTPEELKVLYTCMVAHVAKELVLGLYNHRLQPENPHITTSQAKGWRYLEELWGDPNGRARVEKLWKDTAAVYKKEPA
ncbi:uncharacterized protein LOC119741939 [Patiria miniata]|uniref:Hydroxylysine kinase n=1 Tax=Patiria miniata TaxID=46514 RepID=A0A914BC74_PATMI|nr:uncharacterized protein LOC119741939 [Patiria miniata]